MKITLKDGSKATLKRIRGKDYDEVMDLIDHANTLDIDASASLPPSLQRYYNEDR